MEGKCCLLQFILCGSGSIAADVCITPVRLLKLLSVFLEDESLGSKNLARHVVRR